MSIYPPTGTLEIKNATLKIPVVDLQYTSNTAKLEANSNVVTEFSRSKKLIKYPRVALTSASDNAYENGYKITYSSHYPGDHYPHEAFDNEKGSGSLTLWFSGYNNHYNTSDGSAITDPNNADVAPKLDTNTDYGDWIGIELPNAIELKYFDLYQQYNDSVHFPQSATIYARKLTSDSWTEIYRYDDASRENEPNRATRFTVDSIIAYKYFALVGRQRNQETTGSSGISLGQWELYGVPEYDPDADGVDVTVKSYPNVPNTDWLEVYYDAKGLENGSTTVNDLKPVGTANNGTVGGNTSVTDEAFTFDGTGDYITSTVTTGTGNQSFSVACWFKFTTLGGLLWGFTGTTDGASGSNPTNNSTPHSYFNTTGSITFDFWANSVVTADKLIEANRWYAGVWTYDGTTRKIYIDGTQVHLPQSSTPLSIIDTTSRLSIGIYPTNLSGGPMTGSVANFRLFNRALTSDEVWQLYAYQKEYFGHGDLSMTLKAGRLGIGTSEPRAALDVRGEIRAIGSMFYLLDTPIQNEWYWSGSTSTTGAEVKVIYSQLPDNCRAVYADVFLPQASADDHGSHTLGRDHKQIGALWTAGRSSTTANQPTVYMGDGLSQGSNVVFISQPGQNDNEYYFGNWWPSLTIPLAPGNVLYHGRDGFASTEGWILVYVKGYYV